MGSRRLENWYVRSPFTEAGTAAKQRCSTGAALPPDENGSAEVVVEESSGVRSATPAND